MNITQTVEWDLERRVEGLLDSVGGMNFTIPSYSFLHRMVASRPAKHVWDRLWETGPTSLTLLRNAITLMTMMDDGPDPIPEFL